MAKAKSKKSGIKKYWEQKGRKQAIGSGIDIGGALVGGGLGAVLKGKTAFWVGIGSILAGHLIGDKGRIVQSIGVGATAYGIATIDPLGINSNQPVSGTATGMQGVKERLLTFKDNLLHATFLDKLIKKKETESPPKDTTVGSIDTSELDVFEQYGEQQAYLQALAEEQESEARLLEQNNDFEQGDNLRGTEEPEYEYAPFEVIPPLEIDFNTM